MSEQKPLNNQALNIEGALEFIDEVLFENKMLKMALADAICRPLGVIPDSAKYLIDLSDLAYAELRKIDKGEVAVKLLSNARRMEMIN